MTEPVRIKPAGKNLVRNPDTGGHLDDKDGEMIVLDSYWRRRISDGDVKVLADVATKEAK